ncbi:unnamed protein product, partial [Mesorhabditis belari]|uniref:7TM GPCR serpentine receptor class x (Srx) domain-containing protein n=1 Tax=Mesorhabditis belari TaxID=2138241 RepID=A0AAF3FFT2_9BILA
MSAFYVYSHITIQWLEHAITIHRFFAVSFDGVYYKNVSRGHLLQCALLLILPGIPYFGAIITPLLVNMRGLCPVLCSKYCAVLQPDFGNIFDVLFTGSYYFFGSLCVIALLVDLIALRNIKMRMIQASQLGAASQQRSDIRFSIQMALTHGMKLCYWVLFFLSLKYQFFTKWVLGSQMNFNRLSTIVLSVENLLQGLLLIYFNRAAKVKTVSIEATTTQS